MRLGNAYLVVTLILGIEKAGSYMVPFIPIDINESAIISLVPDDLLLRDFESLSVLVVTLPDGEHFFALLRPQRGLSMAVNSDRWSHIVENDVVGPWHLL